LTDGSLTELKVEEYPAAIISMKATADLVIFGLTDGTICFKKVPSLETLLSISQAHNFGVNCLDLTHLTPSRFLLVSGGDDQQVQARLFTYDKDGLTEHA
jgi:WD40 repeat protein